MSAVCVLTPLVVASWPVVSTAIVGAASSLGFAVASQDRSKEAALTFEEQVELEVPNSDVIGENLGQEQTIRIERDGVKVVLGLDGRGACRMCVTGVGRSKRELRRIGEELSGRIVQHFAYHKLVTELKKRNYHIVDEHVGENQAIRLRVRGVAGQQ